MKYTLKDLFYINRVDKIRKENIRNNQCATIIK